MTWKIYASTFSAKNKIQKENHDKYHKVRTLPDIIPSKEVLFLSPADTHQDIEDTITSHASTPRSYIIESQGRNYHYNHQHICPLHTPIPRPSGAEEPDSHINSNIPGPSATTQTLPNVNTTISRPSMPKPIPAPHCKFLTRQPEQDQICTTTTQTTTNLNQVLAHLTTINHPKTTTLIKHPDPIDEDLVQESSPSSPATSTSSSSGTEDISSDVTTSDETLSTSSDRSTTSTTNDMQLKPKYPINYSEKLLTKLHGILQV